MIYEAGFDIHSYFSTPDQRHSSPCLDFDLTLLSLLFSVNGGEKAACVNNKESRRDPQPPPNKSFSSSLPMSVIMMSSSEQPSSLASPPQRSDAAPSRDGCEAAKGQARRQRGRTTSRVALHYTAGLPLILRTCKSLLNPPCERGSLQLTAEAALHS